MDVAPAQDVLLHEEEGDAFLLHVASGRYFGLNRSGLVVWKALVEGRDRVAALTERWPDADPAVLRSDADDLVASLLEAGLVRPSGAAG